MGDQTTKRTVGAITKAIKQVEKEYKNLPRFSMFGDNNWEKRDAVLEILRQHLHTDGYAVEDDRDELLASLDNDSDDDPESLKHVKLRTYDWLLGEVEDVL